MKPPTSTDPLWRLLEATEQRVDGEALAWLQRGVAVYLRDGVSLDAALGLQRVRGRGARDEHIREAASHLHGTDYQRACALAALVRYPARWRPGRSPVARSLLWAQGCHRLPTSVRAFQRILGSNDQKLGHPGP